MANDTKPRSGRKMITTVSLSVAAVAAGGIANAYELPGWFWVSTFTLCVVLIACVNLPEAERQRWRKAHRQATVGWSVMGHFVLEPLRDRLFYVLIFYMALAVAVLIGVPVLIGEALGFEAWDAFKESLTRR